MLFRPLSFLLNRFSDCIRQVQPVEYLVTLFSYGISSDFGGLGLFIPCGHSALPSPDIHDSSYISGGCPTRKYGPYSIEDR